MLTSSGRIGVQRSPLVGECLAAIKNGTRVTAVTSGGELSAVVLSTAPPARGHHGTVRFVTPRSLVVAIEEPVELHVPVGQGIIVLTGQISVRERDVADLTVQAARRVDQRRDFVRVDAVVPVEVRLSDGRYAPGESVDLSGGGVRIRLSQPARLAAGLRVDIDLWLDGRGAEPLSVPATAVGDALNGTHRFRFFSLPYATEQRLCRYVAATQRKDLRARAEHRTASR